MILSELKSATAELHERVEAAMPSLDALATPGGYLAGVRALHGFHAAWEPAIWSHPGLAALGLHAAERRKLPLLAHDLQALEGDGARSALRPPAPALADTAEALGALYVLEGATLGGQVIARHVGRRHPELLARAGRYFHGYGDATGSMWRAFGTAATSHAAAHDSGRAMIAGATRCFAALERWLAAPGTLTTSTQQPARIA